MPIFKHITWSEPRKSWLIQLRILGRNVQIDSWTEDESRAAIRADFALYRLEPFTPAGTTPNDASAYESPDSEYDVAAFEAGLKHVIEPPAEDLNWLRFLQALDRVYKSALSQITQRDITIEQLAAKRAEKLTHRSLLNYQKHATRLSWQIESLRQYIAKQSNLRDWFCKLALENTEFFKTHSAMVEHAKSELAKLESQLPAALEKSNLAKSILPHN